MKLIASVLILISYSALFGEEFHTYSNEEFSFKIDYPASWRVSEHNPPESGPKGSFSVEFKAPNYVGFAVSIYPTEQPTLDEFLAHRDYNNLTAYEGLPSTGIQKQWPRELDGRHAIMRVESWCAAGFTTLLTYMKVGDLIYTLRLEPLESQYSMKEQSLYYQILDTFRFTKKELPQ